MEECQISLMSLDIVIANIQTGHCVAVSGQRILKEMIDAKVKHVQMFQTCRGT